MNQKELDTLLFFSGKLTGALEAACEYLKQLHADPNKTAEQKKELSVAYEHLKQVAGAMVPFCTWGLNTQLELEKQQTKN